jgi:hypothetical protein
VAEGHDAEPLEVGLAKIGQDLGVDGVVAERLRVLLQAEIP